jgi:hypothetical protein
MGIEAHRLDVSVAMLLPHGATIRVAVESTMQTNDGFAKLGMPSQKASGPLVSKSNRHPL